MNVDSGFIYVLNSLGGGWGRGGLIVRSLDPGSSSRGFLRLFTVPYFSVTS